MLRLLPRFKYRFLSLLKIVEVRNKLLHLYLAPNERLEVAPPDEYLGSCSRVQITSHTIPMFHFTMEGKEYRIWLKCNPPSFDLSIDNEQPDRISFRDKRAIIVVRLIKEFARYFPFLSQDNYLERGGNNVA